MNRRERRKGIRVWRWLAFFIVLLGIFISLTAVAAYYYVNSPGFTSLLEDKLSGSSGKVIRIGSVSLTPSKGLTVTNVTVRENSDATPLLSLDTAGVEFHFLGLISRKIKAVNIKGARVFIDLTKASGTGGDKGKTSAVAIPLLTPSAPLPLKVEGVSLSDLNVLIRTGEGREITVGPVDMDFVYGEGGDGAAFVSVSAEVPGLPEKLSLRAEIDMDHLSLKDGIIETGPVVIGGGGSAAGEGVFALPALSILNGVRGTLDSVIEFEVDRVGRSLSVRYEGSYEGLGIRRPGKRGKAGVKTIGSFDGSINALITLPLDLSIVTLDLALLGSGKGDNKEDRHNLSLKAAYDTERDRLIVGDLFFDSPRLGGAGFKGTFSKLLSGNPSVDARVNLKNISLTHLTTDILRPFEILPSTIILEGTTDSKFTAKGSITGGIEVLSTLRLKGLRVGDKGNISDTKGTAVLVDSTLTIFPKEDRLSLKRLFIKIPKVTTLSSTGSVTGLFSATPTANLKVTLAETEVSAIKPLLPKALKTNLDTLSINGTLSSTVRVKAKPAGANVYGLDISFDGTVKRGAFSTADGYAGGEGVEVKYKGSVTTTLPVKDAAFDVKATASNFVLLVGDFFADLTGKKVVADMKGSFSSDTGGLSFDNASVDFAGAMALDLTGKVASVYKRPAFDLGITLAVPSLTSVYELFIKDNAPAISPALSELKLSGSSFVKLKLSGGIDAFKSTGDLTFDLKSLEDAASGLLIEDLALTLPIDLSWPVYKGKRSEPEAYGTLSLGGAMWSDILFEPLKLRPVIWQNDLLLAEDLSVPLFGGSVDFKGFNMLNILSSERELTVTVAIEDVELQELSLSLGLPPLSGTLSGSIPNVQLRGDTLTTEGEILLSVFNGSIGVSAISVEGLFSPALSVKSDIEIRDLDLGELTGAFEYGSITGVIEGYIKGLVIADGQPESFEAEIATVKRRGISQKISVQALKNISVIGSGGAGAVFSRGIYRLFDSYGYSKLGFSGRLKNDNFILYGVDNDGEKGYLVRGGLIPPRVDVVTYSRNVSFKEMVERLKRIETAN